MTSRALQVTWMPLAPAAFRQTTTAYDLCRGSTTVRKKLRREETACMHRAEAGQKRSSSAGIHDKGAGSVAAESSQLSRVEELDRTLIIELGRVELTPSQVQS
ncbi:hypothetical protein BC628DRAFT_445422 [Trametes gibbosa]|nr:hypothetical protein BC628DRAFT_445422 [Trametes gibbosa]